MYTETPPKDPSLDKLTELLGSVQEILTFLEQHYVWYEDRRIPEALVIKAREIDATLERMASIQAPTH